MTHFTYGVDISKDHLDVSRLPDGTYRRFTFDKTGLKGLVKWLNEADVERIIYEATGRYHRSLERHLRLFNFPLCKVNPRQARCFAEACGQLAKTDRVDAMMLARMGVALAPDIDLPISQAIEDMKDLMMARRALIKDGTAAKNRSKGLLNALLKRQNAARLKQIEKDITAIEDEIKCLVAKDPALKARFDILKTIPGFGDITALSLLIDMPELGTLDNKEAAALMGLAPITKESGNWSGRAAIKGGRRDLRHDLYFPALSACRHNPDLKTVYDRLMEKGKPFKVAIVAIMRKLTILANALLRKNTKWVNRIA